MCPTKRPGSEMEKFRHGLLTRGTMKNIIISVTLGANNSPGDNNRGRFAMGSGGRPNHVRPTTLPGSENKMLSTNFLTRGSNHNE